MILKRYPDYGRAPAEYVLAIIEIIASYPITTIEHLADIKIGVSAACKFLPTVADVVECAKVIEMNLQKFAPAREIQRRPVDPEEYHAKQIPRVYDRFGERVRPEDQIDDAKWREGMARTQRMTMFVAELGEGDSLRGWEIAMERGLNAPPEDWQPKARQAAE